MPPGVYRALQAFAAAHQGCGPDAVALRPAPPPTPTGYQLSAECVCGERWERWVTPSDAHHDMIFTAILAHPN